MKDNNVQPEQQTGPTDPASSLAMASRDVIFECSKCSQSIVIDSQGAGLAIQCPHCQVWLQVPSYEAAAFIIEEINDEPKTPETAVQPQPESAGHWFLKFMPWWKKARKPPPENDPLYNETTARSAATAPETLKKILEHGRSDFVSQLAANNPHCPPDTILALVTEALSNGRRTTLALYALRNSACPTSLLISVAKRMVLDDFSRAALLHRNMPEAVIEELVKGGDDDLRCFVQECPACSAALIDAIARGDRKSHATIKAIRSPKCSEETLVRILSSSESDAAALAVLMNPNCSARMIHSILMRGEDDEISVRAAAHGKCSKDTMNMVFGRKRKDQVSSAMARSGYCLKDLKKKWMENTGQVEGAKTEATQAAAQQTEARDEILREMRPTDR